eukprot:CAMPEP_0176462762 /NCGR_PEP_ID=MMETSP0127-20121128/35474_1 /TAXON_ID=938130 /ORGANISM="Platyophrya macrostoma, Strain WH" /LENGTH=355 /DNA_ID=CAMNT_0017854769 /DNA_START=150 /DNA_END=1216 /DNA_ORIENTATION=+
MLNNQFYDFELECPYFHNRRDKRRIVLKANYLLQQNGQVDQQDGAHSYNYFESVYHPLFYKFFECKRLQCKGSIYCAMKHSEEERVAWEEEFAICWKKDRSIYYPKKGKNSSQTEAGSEDGQSYSSNKAYRQNGYNSKPNSQGRQPSNQYQSQAIQKSHINKGDRGKYQEKSRLGPYKKEYQYKKRPDYQHLQQFDARPYEQGGDDPLDSQYQDYNDQYAQEFLDADQSNGIGLAQEFDNPYSDFLSPYGYNQGYEFSLSLLSIVKARRLLSQELALGGNQYQSGSKMNKKAGFGYQDSDDEGDPDFESIFSSISQYSQSFNSASTGSTDKKPLHYKKSKAFYPGGSKDGHIEVK